MKGRHLALIVEDDGTSAEDLTEILKSLACDAMVADNKQDALTLFQKHPFCFVLLDLAIRHDRDSIKAQTAHGQSLLREIRELNADHIGSSYRTPIIIVSGFAREVAAAVEVMKDGASDIVQKPFNSRAVSDAVSRALERSGRVTHNLCRGNAKPLLRGPGTTIILSIPGDRDGRRTRVLVAGKTIWLPDGPLRVLLHLMCAHAKGMGVHKTVLGSRKDQGFKGVSILREALRPALADGVSIIGNDQHGSYQLAVDVDINDCNAEALAEIGDATITALAAELALRLRARVKV